MINRFKYFICVLFGILLTFVSYAGTRTLKSFGAKGDGITDDSGAIKQALLFCQNGTTINGQGLTYLFESPIKASLKQFHLVNCKLVLGRTFKKQGYFEITSTDVLLENISIDGGRGTYVKENESWGVFASENKVNSICPSRPDFFLFFGMSKSAKFDVKKMDVKNLHSFSAITIYTLGKVTLSDLKFQNLSYKTFHIYHSNDDGKTTGGLTTVSNAYAKNIGLLPSKLYVDLKLQQRATLKMMPQASFNFIVSFGSYIASNLHVSNYGSTAVTADRNDNFIADSIRIDNSSNTSFSNNPSGGLWLEKCKNVNIKSVNINVSARDKRDLLFDSSAIHIYSVNGRVLINDLWIKCSNIASLNKGLRASLLGKCELNIKNLTLEGVYQSFAGLFSILDDQVSSTINIGNLNLNSKSLGFYGMKNISINKLQGKTGNEAVNFTLPNGAGSNEAYLINGTNLKSIGINKQVKNIKITGQPIKFVFKFIN